VQAPYLADGVPKLHTFNVIHLQVPVISRIEPSIKSITCKQPSPIVCRVGSKWVKGGGSTWVLVVDQKKTIGSTSAAMKSSRIGRQ
jgi:hypothetical protein